METPPQKLEGALLRAFVAAPLGALVTLGVIAVPYLVLEEDWSLVGQASTWAFFGTFLAVGTAIAYLMTVVVIWPGYAVLHRLGWLNVGTVLLGGALAGALAVPLAWHGLIGRTHIEWLLYLGGAIAGDAAGVVFWVLHVP